MYEKLVKKLYQINQTQPAVKLGLLNAQRLHQALGNPSKAYPVIHVAGTNGKGSVSQKLAKSFEVSGYKTGLFVSPHIASYRERMQINSEYISEKQVGQLLPELFSLTQKESIPATFFELTTLMALKHFQQQHVDVAVVEVGLGGRLDSTNIVDPLLSVITSIGLDHTRILGNTIEDIAKEKAGIMKPSIPVVLGPNTPTDVLRAHAELVGCPVLAVPSSNSVETTTDYDFENTRTAMLALESVQELVNAGKSDLHVTLDSDAVQRALRTRPPCRFEVLKLDGVNDPDFRIVLDVAHNAPAMTALVEKLKRDFPGRNIRVVCGFAADKNIQECVDILLQVAPLDRIHFVQAQHRRCASLEEIRFSLRPHCKQRCDELLAEPRIDQGITQAINKAVPRNEIVVVCGSVFLMGEARETLGLDYPRDSEAISSVAGSHLKGPDDRLENLATGTN